MQAISCASSAKSTVAARERPSRGLVEGLIAPPSCSFGAALSLPSLHRPPSRRSRVRAFTSWMTSDGSASGVTVLPVIVLRTVSVSSHNFDTVLAHFSCSPCRQCLDKDLRVISRARHSGRCRHQHRLHRTLCLSFQWVERFRIKSFTLPGLVLSLFAMDNDSLLYLGDGDTTLLPLSYRLTRADPGERLGRTPRGKLLSCYPKTASVFGMESVLVNNSRLSSRGKLQSSSSAFVWLLSCEGQTLLVGWNTFLAMGLAVLNQQRDRPVGVRTRTSFDIEEQAM